MSKPIQILIFAIVAAAFAWLAQYSLAEQEHGYTARERHDMDRLIGRYVKPKFSDRQAEALRDVWHLTDADIARPVQLFSANGEAK